MSMYSYVEGFIPPDQKFNEMMEIWNVCERVGVTIPKEVMDFFGHTSPDPSGMVVRLDLGHPAIRRYNQEMRDGFEVDLTKLPEHIKTIRFVNSY